MNLRLLRHSRSKVFAVHIRPHPIEPAPSYLFNNAPLLNIKLFSTLTTSAQFHQQVFCQILSTLPHQRPRSIHMSTKSFQKHTHDDLNSPKSLDEHDHEHSHNEVANETNQHIHSHDSTPGHSHSHDHEHSHGGLSMLTHTHTHNEHNELLSSSLSNPAVRITWIGLITNVALAISKAIGGIYFHSQSLMADAIHSFSDMIADFLTLATVNVANKIGSPDKFPLGYGKLESAGALFVSGVLLFAGISVGWSSLLQVFEFTMPSYIYEYVSKIQIGHSHTRTFDLGVDSSSHEHNHSHGTAPEPVVKSDVIPDINAAWLAGGSIFIKELLFQKTMKIANETQSKVLVANAWHHRVDSLTAFVAVLTVTGGNLFGVAWLDSVGGLLVSALIIKAGWGSFRVAVMELLDRGESKTSDDSLKFKSFINQSLQGEQFKISNISVLTSGANSNIFLTLVGPNSNVETINEINALEEKIVSGIKSQDKFVRNVFVQFKKVDVAKYNSLTDQDINEND